jgi:hypothetical protein
MDSTNSKIQPSQTLPEKMGVFIKTGFHRMACSSNAQFNLVFKTVRRISVALPHPKLLMIWWE